MASSRYRDVQFPEFPEFVEELSDRAWSVGRRAPVIEPEQVVVAQGYPADEQSHDRLSSAPAKAPEKNRKLLPGFIA